MIKINKILIILLIFSLLSPVLFFNNNIVKSSGGIILLSDFDDVASGLDDFQSGYFIGNNTGVADKFQISTYYYYSSPNSLEFRGSDTDEEGYLNLTTDFDYIWQLNFSFIWRIGTGNHYIQMDFNDINNNSVMQLRFLPSNGGNEKIYWKDVTLGWTLIYDTNIVTNTKQNFLITHTGTNQFNIIHYNDAFGVISIHNNAGSYAGSYTNFSQIFFSCYNFGGGTSGMYFDDFIIDITPEDFDIGDYDGGRCSNPIGGYDMIFEIGSDCEPNWLCMLACQPFRTLVNCIDTCMDCDWTMIPAKYIEHETETSYCETIRHVILPISNAQMIYVSDDPLDYYLMINDEYIGAGDYILPYDNGYAVTWANINKSVDGKILFSFYCSEHTTDFSKDWYWYGLAGYYGGWGTTKVHNEISNFYDGVLSGTYMGNFKLSVCWYYNDSCNESLDPYKLPIINEFDQTFGLGDTGVGYIEFLGYDETCYYKINRNLHVPTVVYNLTGFGNGTKTYLFQINKVKNGTHDTIVYNGFVEVVNTDYKRDVRILHDFSFEDYGAGQYYIMCYNTSSYGTVIEEFAHRSITIMVCPEEKYTEPITGNWHGLPYWTPYIIGIFITLFVTISPLILALYVSRNRNNKNIPKIPSLLYVGFFFMGLTISVLMGFLPSWLPFIILFGMIVFFAVQWLYGSRPDVEGE